MEKKKYSVEQFKRKFVKPTPDRECVTIFMQYSQNARSYFSNHISPLHF